MHRNTILYTTMIKSYSTQKKLRKALKAMEEMDAEGVPLNCVTYNSLIDAAIRCRDLPAATKLLEQMKEQGIVPDLITYSTLIKGFCDQGNIQVAISLLQRLKTQNMKCDEILYNSLLEGCVKAGEVQRGVDLFQEMVMDKVPMSNITFSIMVKLYAQAGRLDQAMDLVQRMDPEFKVKPTNVVFPCLVKCCALDMALDILEQLCAAPYAVEGAVGRTLNLYPIAQSLFEAVAQSNVLQKEKARTLLQGPVRATRLLTAEQERQILALLPATTSWGGEEFVPGKAWTTGSTAMDWQPKEFTPGTMWDESMGYEGWQAYADPYYGAYVEDWAASQTQ